MKLVTARVKMFRHILDSDDVAIQPDVTSLVGKNESGKTAFLQAIERINPVRPNVKISAAAQYPAWLEKKHRRETDLEKHAFAFATFELTSDEMAVLEARFGEGILKSTAWTMSREYDGTRRFTFRQDDAVSVSKISSSASDAFKARTPLPVTLAELDELIASLSAEGGYDEAAADAKALLDARKLMLGDRATISLAIVDALDAMTPKFFYFSEYSTLPGSVKIRELLSADPKSLSGNQTTALSLLRLAGADDDYLLQPDYETRKREMENVSNALTEDILEYWTTNKQIRVEVDITQITVEEKRNIPVPPHGTTTVTSTSTVLDELKIRLRDDRHSLSLSFNERSTGFKWFFSFLAAFSAYEGSQEPLVILLDEPGLGLHARAQKDFLRFIDERLGKKRQVIYSTHSPFMIQPGHLERVRLVEDKGREFGSKVTSDVLATDRDTLFPLQAALGYDMAQHLFIAPHNLIVEGTSDFTYMVTLSRHLASLGREALKSEWSIIPVGGADMIPTFVALLGNHLDVTVVVDSQKAGHQKLDRMAAQGLLKANRIVTVGQAAGLKFADIEDLFATEDYLALFNAAFGGKLKASDLKGADRILERIERARGGRFDHGKPADEFLRRRDEFLPKLAPETLDRFEALFRIVNATMSPKS